MNRIIKNIPNTLTLFNLLTGCIGIVFLLNGNIMSAIYMIWLSAIFDFFDGYTARILNAYSNVGKQLDSLADMVSFGFLPALMLYTMVLNNSEILLLPYISLLVSVFLAIRLARFYLD